jgi:hypothetical protein
MFIFVKNLWKIQNLTNDSLNRRQCLSNCSRSAVSSPLSSNASGDARVPEGDARLSTESLARDRPVRRQNIITGSTLLLPVNVLRHPQRRQASQSTPQTSWSPPHAQTQGPQLLHDPLCFFPIPACSSEVVGSWEFSDSKTSSASYVRICALGLIWG